MLKNFDHKQVNNKYNIMFLIVKDNQSGREVSRTKITDQTPFSVNEALRKLEKLEDLVHTIKLSNTRIKRYMEGIQSGSWLSDIYSKQLDTSVRAFNRLVERYKNFKL